jgi:hypothetical protein
VPRSDHDTTPLAELRRNVVATVVMFLVVGIGAFAVVALRDCLN